MTMTTHFNVPGKKRKELAHAIADFIGSTATYAGAPSFAYEIEYFTLDKDGNLEYDTQVERALILDLQETLTSQGFEFDFTDDDRQVETEGEEQETGVEGLTVSVPLDKVNAGNLTNLLEAKGTLIKKALGIDDLSIEISEDKVSFPWFHRELTADEVKAYTHFIATLCQMSSNQKRIAATEKAVENEKYAFRCFLLRLGFIGEEFKVERKILLQNLSGSSAFRSGSKPIKATTEPLPENFNPFPAEEMIADAILIHEVNQSIDEEVAE